MLTTECYCGNPKNPNAQQCWECGNEARRQALVGHGATPETRRRLSEAAKRHPNRFDIGAYVQGKPSAKAKPVGSTRVENGHIKIKCPDGEWRYRARVMWEAAYGPIPPARLIHHVNEDPFDDRLDNFQMVTRSEHARIHSTPERARSAQRLAVAARKRNGSN